MKWQPMRDLPSLFSDFFNHSWISSRFIHADVPLINAKEDEKEYTLEVLAPKLAPEDLKIEVEDDMLHITSQKEIKEESSDTLIQEYSLSYSDRSFRLPKDADAENITATSDTGLILIHIPKKPEEKPARKLIEIQ